VRHVLSLRGGSGWRTLTRVPIVDDLVFFELQGEEPTADQRAFLGALRERLEDRLWPYCGELTERSLLLVLDVDAPEVALVSVGLELRGRTLRGDRISIHDRAFPLEPTSDGFIMEGSAVELAARGVELLERFANAPVVKHEWLHRGRVYAECYLFADSGERLAQMYRSDWAPLGQEDRLVAEGSVHGKGWIQTRGLGGPDRIVRVRGTHGPS
jgi:hypothetical protein